MRSSKLILLIVAVLTPLGCQDGIPDPSPQELEFRGLEDGLLLHWTFEDRNGNQILDVSGNGRHGTLQAGTFVSSPAGEAVSLDGVDDYVSFVGPRSPALYGGVDGAFTVSARVRVADVNKYNTLCYGCGPINSLYVGTPSYGNRVIAALFDQDSGGLTWPWSSAALTNDTWTEVTMVVEGGVGTRYYLGCKLDAEVLNPNVGLKDYNFSSLGTGGAADRWFEGQVDELRIWDRALSEGEIDELCGEPPADDGLELHWTFEDRSGNQILDISGNNRHGTLHGGSFVAGPIGDAVSLDGVDDYIALVGPRAPAIYGGVDGDFTLSTRVRVADLGKENTLCYGCGPFNTLYIGTASYGARAMAAIFNQSTGGLAWPKSSPALSEDEWVEVTMVVEGGVGTRYYFDCALDSELLDPNVGLKDYNFSAVGLGSNPSRWFGGEIDELRIWNRALSGAEIDDLCPKPLEHGLMLHYTFEDRSGNTVFDLSGNGRDATLHDGAFVSSPFGEAVSLDGVDDYLSLDAPADPALYGGPQGSFTLSAYVRVDDIGKYNMLCYGCAPFQLLSVGYPEFYKKRIALANLAGVSYFESSSTLSSDTWIEITLVVEGGVGARYYLDGVPDAALINSNVVLQDYGWPTIGKGTSSSSWFGGEIDELRIWNRALSEAEIAQIVAGRVLLRSGLELHWTFEDKNGNTILDMSGKGRHGTKNGGVFVASPLNEALRFDGIDDYVTLYPSAPSLRDPAIYGGEDGALTISSRLRVDDVERTHTLCSGCGPLHGMFVGKLAGGNRAMGKLLDQNTAGFLYPMSSSSLVDDTWVEVTMTVDGTTGARFYLDCDLDSELANPNIGLKDYNYTTFGQGSSASTWFGGDLDNFRVWSRVLTDEELEALCEQ